MAKKDEAKGHVDNDRWNAHKYRVFQDEKTILKIMLTAHQEKPILGNSV